MGHKSGLGLEVKKIPDRFPVYSPLEFHSAGWALHKKGGYGGFLGKGVSGKEEIRSAIQTLAESGADFIKITNSGIVSLQEEKPVTEGGFPETNGRLFRRRSGGSWSFNLLSCQLGPGHEAKP